MESAELIDQAWSYRAFSFALENTGAGQNEAAFDMGGRKNGKPQVTFSVPRLRHF